VRWIGQNQWLKNVLGWPISTIAADVLNNFDLLHQKRIKARMALTLNHVRQYFSSLAHIAMHEDFTRRSAKRMWLKNYRQYPNPYFSICCRLFL
jgi:hypothetical protein